MMLPYLRSKLAANKMLMIILVISVVLRVTASLIIGNTVVELPGTADQLSYHKLALRVMDGHGFSFGQGWWPMTRAGEPTAHWSFLYTFYLVAVYSLFGPNPLAARIIQAVIVGILHPLLAYLIGQKIYNRTIGLIAAALTAVYIYFFYYAGTLMTEPFYITTILAALYLCVLPPVKASAAKFPWRLFALGVILGVTVLLRQLFLLIIPFLLLWLWLRDLHTDRKGWFISGLKLALPLVIVGLMILPFTLFNYARFDRFVLLNTNAGYAFFFGNHPVYGTNFVGILTPEMGSYGELIPEELRHLDEAALDQALLNRAFEFITDDPLRYIMLSLSRIPVYFQFWPSQGSGIISNISRVGSFGLLLPFMIYGLYRSYLAFYLRNIYQPLFLLLFFTVIYTGIHLLTWALIRYRLPVDAVLLIPTGLGISVLFQRISNRMRKNSGQKQSDENPIRRPVRSR
jgi:4-amino-4-deoxy-L-arabinose transferase-like glycosyltransferase